MNDSILVTLSKRTIEERRYGYRMIVEEWSQADGEQSVWYYRCGNAPKQDFVYIYWVIGGRIRWRSRILDVYRNMSKKPMYFDNQQNPQYGKNWLSCIDFKPIPRELQINHKGFQGFRYFDSSQIQF